MALSPDGRFLAWPVKDPSIKFTDPRYSRDWTCEGSRIRLFDIAADKPVDRFPGFKGDADDLVFADNGKTLISVDHRDGMVRLWNVETAKEEMSFQAVPDAEKKQPDHVRRTTLSPDGKTLAVAYDAGSAGRQGFFLQLPHLVRLWDMATGKEQRRLNGHLHYIRDMAFSPDGRLLVTAGEKYSDLNGEPPNPIDQVFVWETATGKRVAALPEGLPLGATAAAFSRDGRFLATALPEGAIRVWEVATWTVRNEFKGHRDPPTALIFAPGGQLLSGSVDTTVLAWDIRPPRILAAGPLETAWTDLGKWESRAAFQAKGQFLSAPAQAVKVLADKIGPVEAASAQRLQQLIAELDSAKFSERQSAARTLGELGEQAKPYLEKAVKTPKSAEALDRTRKILDGLSKKTSEQLRQMRAVLVLELINDDESRNLLRKWAGGFKGRVPDRGSQPQVAQAAASRGGCETLTYRSAEICIVPLAHLR